MNVDCGNRLSIVEYIREAISGKTRHNAYTDGIFTEDSNMNDVTNALEEIGITRVELYKTVKGYDIFEELIKKSIKDDRRYYMPRGSTITIVVTSEIAYILIFLKQEKGVANIYRLEYDSDRDVAKVTGEYSMSPTLKLAIKNILSGLSEKFS